MYKGLDMEKNTDRISIIVPVHNASKTLDACVKSIIEQDYADFECILVENGSVDNSAALCKEYSEKYSCVKFVISESKGASEARNLGLSLATGKFIGFADADDMLEPGSLRRVADEFQRNCDIAAVIGAFFIGWKVDEEIQKKYKGLNAKKISPAGAIALTVGNDAVMGSVWNKYYRTEVIRNIKFDSELSYCEDTHFNVKVLSSMPEKYGISLIDTPLYCYMMNESSLTHQSENLYDAEGNLKYNVALKKILMECSLDKKCQSIVKKAICGLAIDYYRIGNKVQREKIKEDIIKYYRFLLENILYSNYIENVKKVIKGILIILKLNWW